MHDDMNQKSLELLYRMKKNAEIALGHAKDRRMKNPDCCALCKEIRSLDGKLEVINYLIGMVMANG